MSKTGSRKILTNAYRFILFFSFDNFVHHYLISIWHFTCFSCLSIQKFNITQYILWLLYTFQRVSVWSQKDLAVIKLFITKHTTISKHVLILPQIKLKLNTFRFLDFLLIVTVNLLKRIDCLFIKYFYRATHSKWRTTVKTKVTINYLSNQHYFFSS